MIDMCDFDHQLEWLWSIKSESLVEYTLISQIVIYVILISRIVIYVNRVTIVRPRLCTVCSSSNMAAKGIATFGLPNRCQGNVCNNGRCQNMYFSKLKVCLRAFKVGNNISYSNRQRNTESNWWSDIDKLYRLNWDYSMFVQRHAHLYFRLFLFFGVKLFQVKMLIT